MAYTKQAKRSRRSYSEGIARTWMKQQGQRSQHKIEAKRMKERQKTLFGTASKMFSSAVSAVKGVFKKPTK